MTNPVRNTYGELVSNKINNFLGMTPAQMPITLGGDLNGLGIDWGLAPTANNTFNPALGVDQNFATAMQANAQAPFLSWDSFAGKMGPNGWTPGWGMQGMQALGGLASAWNGMQQLDLAKDQFAFQKRAYEQNYNNQKTLTNAYLRDRQARRIAEGTAQGTVDDYMDKNGIK